MKQIKKGLTLNMKNLIKRDARLLDELNSVFEEAQRLSEKMIFLSRFPEQILHH